MKAQVTENGGTEILRVRDLFHRAPLTTGIQFALIRRILSLDQQLRLKRRDSRGRRPNSPRKTFAAFHFDHCPRQSCLFNPATKRGVTRRQQAPICGHREHAPIGAHHVAWSGKRSDFAGFSQHAAEATRQTAKLKPEQKLTRIKKTIHGGRIRRLAILAHYQKPRAFTPSSRSTLSPNDSVEILA